MRFLLLFWSTVAIAQPGAPYVLNPNNPFNEPNQKPFVFFDCALKSPYSASCDELVRGLLSEVKSYEQTLNRTKADLILELRDQLLANDTLYLFEGRTVSKPQAILAEGTLKFSIQLLNSIDGVSRTNQIIKGLIQILRAFEVISRKTDSEESNEEDPLYFDVRLNGNFSRRGERSENYTGNFQSNLTLMYPHWKFNLNTFTYTQSQSVNSSTGLTRGNYVSLGTFNSISYQFSDHWSFGVITSTFNEPTANTTFGTRNGAGLEWNLIPYRVNENKEVIIRFGAMNRYLKFERNNILDQKEVQFTTLIGLMAFYWNSTNNRTTLNHRISGEYNPRYPDFSEVGFNNSISYQVSKRIRLNATLNFDYRFKSITDPLDFSGLNPVELQFLSNQKGLTTNATLGLNFIFGNQLRKNRDRRWLFSI